MFNSDNNKKIIKGIKSAFKRMDRITEYNLSGSGWQDGYTASERASLYAKNEAARAKKYHYYAHIYELVELYISLGYDTDELLGQFEAYDQNRLLDIIRRINDTDIEEELHKTR